MAGRTDLGGLLVSDRRGHGDNTVQFWTVLKFLHIPNFTSPRCGVKLNKRRSGIDPVRLMHKLKTPAATPTKIPERIGRLPTLIL
jgi:hypothetical protein